MKITQISSAGLAFIAKFEGFRDTAYRDTGGVWTIGYGTIRYYEGTRVKEGDKITKQNAELCLHHDLTWAEKAVDELTRDDITQNQFDALVSFVYNCGVNAYTHSTLRQRVQNKADNHLIRAAFMMWTKDNGRIIKGLVNRRGAEADLYLS